MKSTKSTKPAARRTGAKKVNSKKQLQKSKKLKISSLSRFRKLSRPTQLLFFMVTFAVIGGGLYLWRTLASDGLPSKPNQLIISYEIGMPHQIFEDNFPTGMPPAMLLYGNGLMLCGNLPADIGTDNAHAAHNELSFRTRQLTRQEIHQLVNELKSSGFDQAAEYKNETEDFVQPSAVGRFIRLNRGQGAEMASRYPGDAAVAFDEVEKRLQAECEKATAEYNPDDIVVEAITLPDNHPDAAKTTQDLPAGVEIEKADKKTKVKREKGSEAVQLKANLTKSAKVYRKDGKAVRARYLPKVPDFEAMTPKQENSDGKVFAANQMQTRWLMVVASDQSTPSSASSNINEVATSVRSWYGSQVGANFDISQISVVKGRKTVAQYMQCPSGKNCQGYSSLAAYYNLQAEFKQDGVNTNVLTAFNTGNACMGWGGPVDGDQYKNVVGVYNYGFAVTPAGAGSCDWYDGQHVVAAHEGGHGFGLAHTCDATLMGSCGYTKPAWTSIILHSTQASLLRSQSPYFNPYQTAALDCSGIPMSQQINFSFLSSPPTPSRDYVQSTTAPDGSRRDYYYQYSGSGTFYNHNINYISPTNSSYRHSDSNGNHGIILDYSPYFYADPARAYQPAVNYHYIYRWTGALYVQQHTTSGTPTTYTQSSGDGAGGKVTDQLTNTKYVNTASNVVYGPQLGPCSGTSGGTTGGGGSTGGGGKTKTDNPNKGGGKNR